MRCAYKLLALVGLVLLFDGCGKNTNFKCELENDDKPGFQGKEFIENGDIETLVEPQVYDIDDK